MKCFDYLKRNRTTIPRPGTVSRSFPNAVSGWRKYPESFRKVFPVGKSVQSLSGRFSRWGKVSRVFPEGFPGGEKYLNAVRAFETVPIVAIPEVSIRHGG
jgi:hypothetical protein